MINLEKVWVFLPAFNEAQVIQGVIQRIKACGFSNIVVIDDGSSDNTAECARLQGVYSLSFCINRGVGAAIQAAIIYAKRKGIDYLVLIDADGQHYPEDIPVLLEAMENEQADIVIGSRFLDRQSKIPKSRIFFNKIANLLTTMGQTTVSDSQSGFRLLNKKSIESLDLELDSYGVCTEMIWKTKKQNLRLVEVPIRVLYNAYSMSKGQNFWKGIKTAYSLLKNLIG